MPAGEGRNTGPAGRQTKYKCPKGVSIEFFFIKPPCLKGPESHLRSLLLSRKIFVHKLLIKTPQNIPRFIRKPSHSGGILMSAGKRSRQDQDLLIPKLIYCAGKDGIPSRRYGRPSTSARQGLFIDSFFIKIPFSCRRPGAGNAPGLLHCGLEILRKLENLFENLLTEMEKVVY